MRRLCAGAGVPGCGASGHSPVRQTRDEIGAADTPKTDSAPGTSGLARRPWIWALLACAQGLRAAGSPAAVPGCAWLVVPCCSRPYRSGSWEWWTAQRWGPGPAPPAARTTLSASPAASSRRVRRALLHVLGGWSRSAALESQASDGRQQPGRRPLRLQGPYLQAGRRAWWLGGPLGLRRQRQRHRTPCALRDPSGARQRPGGWWCAGVMAAQAWHEALGRLSGRCCRVALDWRCCLGSSWPSCPADKEREVPYPLVVK